MDVLRGLFRKVSEAQMREALVCLEGRDRRLPGEILIFDHNLANATVSGVLDLHDPAPALHVLAATEGARVFSIRPFVTVILPPR